MTFAPPSLVALGKYWRSQGGVLLGIVGDPAHASKGISYHLGESQLTAKAYSRVTTRDRAGLTEAASAIDLGRLDGNLTNLRAFSAWLVDQCQANAEGTRDIREVIYATTVKGTVKVVRYDREQGIQSEPDTGEADNSHLTHTHVSFYRDSQGRDKVGIFAPYFEEEPVIGYTILNGPVGSLVVNPGPAVAYLDLETGKLVSGFKWTSKAWATAIRLDKPIVAGKPPTDDWTLGYLIGDSPAFLLARNVTFTPSPGADCSAQDAALAQIHTLSNP
jgi:hypothetical protein